MTDVDVTREEDVVVVGDDAPPPDVAEEATPRRRRTLRSDLRRLVGTPARRGRLTVVVLVLAIAVAAPLVARARVADARIEARAQGAEQDGAAETRAEVEAAEEAAAAEEVAALDLAAQAREQHNEQRRRLAGLGLNEQTIDAYLGQVNSNAELVEFWRERTSAEVERQAGEIPEMQTCVRVASQTLNKASNNAMIDRSIPVPSPTDLCMALLAAGT